MLPLNGSVLALLALFGLFLLHSHVAQAENEVDLALVLAVHVSRSMDPEEQQRQRHVPISLVWLSAVIDGAVLRRFTQSPCRRPRIRNARPSSRQTHFPRPARLTCRD
jgi:Protein of unknown function (DUF1194)